MRADLGDGLDVQRLFTESIAAFGGVDVVVHTTTGNAAPLYQHLARYVGQRGAVLITSPAESIAPQMESQLSGLGIMVGRVRSDAVLPFLDKWWRQTTG